MQRSATLSSIATRLNNLEQKFEGLGAGNDDALERLYKIVMFGAYTISPTSPPNPFTTFPTVFDVLSGSEYQTQSVVFSVFGADFDGTESPGLKSTYDLGGWHAPFYEQVFAIGDKRFLIGPDPFDSRWPLADSVFGSPTTSEVDFGWWLRTKSTAFGSTDYVKSVMHFTYGSIENMELQLARGDSFYDFVLAVDERQATMDEDVAALSIAVDSMSTAVGSLSSSISALQTAMDTLAQRVSDIEERLYRAHIPPL